MKRLIIAAFILFIVPALASESKPDKLISTKTITGEFVGFQEGDYLHAIVRTAKGEIIGFFTNGEECFLASNKDKKLIISYNMVKHYFPEGGDYFPASFITNIKTSDQKTTSWTKSTKDLSPENCG